MNCPGCGAEIEDEERYCSSDCRHIVAEIRAEYSVGRPLTMPEAQKAWLDDDISEAYRSRERF